LLTPEQILKDKQQVLWQELSRQLRDSGDKNYIDVAGRVHDLGDESVADVLADLDLSHLENETRELKDIEVALARIRTGSYGSCIDCGKQIDADRLEAYPTAKRCLDCQVLHEDARSERDATPSL